MAAWWQSLSTLEQILLYIAVPATLILLIQTVLLFVGGTMDSDGAGGDAGLDGDLDGDSGPCLLDHALDGGEPPSDDPASAGLHIFTVRGVVTFLVLFGWGGLWLSQVGLHPALVLFLAVDMGIAGMVGVSFILREAARLQYDGTLNRRNTMGLTGTVYLVIPAARSAPGKVNVTVQDQLREFEALTDSETPIPTGAPIRVTGLLPEALLVMPLDDSPV